MGRLTNRSTKRMTTSTTSSSDEDRDQREDDDVAALVTGELRHRDLDTHVAAERARRGANRHEAARHRPGATTADGRVVDRAVRPRPRRGGDLGDQTAQGWVGAGGPAQVGSELLVGVLGCDERGGKAEQRLESHQLVGERRDVGHRSDDGAVVEDGDGDDVRGVSPTQHLDAAAARRGTTVTALALTVRQCGPDRLRRRRDRLERGNARRCEAVQHTAGAVSDEQDLAGEVDRRSPREEGADGRRRVGAGKRGLEQRLAGDAAGGAQRLGAGEALEHLRHDPDAVVRVALRHRAGLGGPAVDEVPGHAAHHHQRQQAADNDQLGREGASQGTDHAMPPGERLSPRRSSTSSS